MIELMPVRDPGPDPDAFARYQPGLRHLALRVSNFDMAYDQLKSLGVKFLFEPANTPSAAERSSPFETPKEMSYKSFKGAGISKRTQL